MLILADDTRFLNWKVQNTGHHLEELKRRLPWKEFYKSGRLVCSLGESYAYSGQITKGHSFELYKPLEDLMVRLNNELGTEYNSVLLNWYSANKKVGIGAHSDDESSLIPSEIASVSLGMPCIFRLRCKSTSEVKDVTLNDGAVFIMGKECQRHYTHEIPYRIMLRDRISLTFRQFKV